MTGHGVGSNGTQGRRGPSSGGFDLAAFRRWRFAGGLFCPLCDGRAVHRWGRFGDRRRYRCLGCGRTFSDLTGTPLAHLKRLDLWPAFCDRVLEASSLRSTARALRVHLATAFRWRHRLLDALRSTESVRLSGEVAVADTCFPFSEKGRRDLDRPARVRGDLFWWLGPRVWLVLARDAAARPWAEATGPARPCVTELEHSLAPRLAPDARISTGEGPYSEVARFARRQGRRYRRLRGAALCHHPAALYGAQMRRWLGRFQGVATRYLPNYLVWHRFLVLSQISRLDRKAARASLLVYSFP